ncbi:histone-like nucleoid-structuring protein Lsr2 [Kribbella solani]|uniref:histone-like nucleoid-structuring protein Lsr2 n=1 Tax=Kribbella solani TaxID=236067 RepID=UPI0029BBB695|nr:Lsr2 family protein [Kribbella solani]MDX2972367.1 Lsr2 family protein [Kribbella solani]
MAQRTQIFLTDDLDGTDIPAGKGETVTFALDGQTYEIDLTNKNAGALRKALSPYVEAGRRVTTSRGARVKHTQVDPDARTVKEWARSNGYEVNDRGRVPKEIREAFEAAN